MELVLGNQTLFKYQIWALMTLATRRTRRWNMAYLSVDLSRFHINICVSNDLANFQKQARPISCLYVKHAVHIQQKLIRTENYVHHRNKKKYIANSNSTSTSNDSECVRERQIYIYTFSFFLEQKQVLLVIRNTIFLQTTPQESRGMGSPRIWIPSQRGWHP